VRRLVELLDHRIWARVALAVIAALVILPNLGGPGLWEPQELAVADRAVARAEKAAKAAAGTSDAAPVPAVGSGSGARPAGGSAAGSNARGVIQPGPAKAAEPEVTPSAPPSPPPETETDPDPETETDPDPDPETETETETDPETETETETDPATGTTGGSTTGTTPGPASGSATGTTTGPTTGAAAGSAGTAAGSAATGSAAAGTGTGAVPPPRSTRPRADDRQREPPPVAAQAPLACPKSPPTDDGARTLTDQLLARDAAADSGGMRWPLALLGLLVVAGIAGIGFRLGSTRAGVLAGLVCLSFPLLSLQARMLTSEIGTPAGGVLIVYGALFSLRSATGVWRIADAITSAAAVAIGCWLAYESGGVLLGVVVPVGAIAIAGGLGWTAVRDLGRIVGPATDAAIARLARSPRRLIPPPPSPLARPRADADAWLAGVIALVATVATIALVAVLAVQLYDLRDPIPGTRALWGKSIIASECWSTALGGLWKANDTVTAGYDVAFEQIAFGTFPWGIAAPIAVGALLGSARPEHRRAALIAIVWGAGAWLATIAFQRKVGFTIYAGFPAMALAIGMWLDGVIDQLTADPDREPDVGWINVVAIVFVVLGIVTMAKDLQTFPERLTSLLVGKDAIKYPKNATLLALPLRLWILVLGAMLAAAVGLALGLATATPARRRRWRAAIHAALGTALVLTVGFAAFWTHGWQTRLARVLSSKSVFAAYRDVAKDGDVLGIVGDLGSAPRYYAGGTWEKLAGRDKGLAFLQRTDGKRAFVLSPVSDACGFHKAAAGKPYYVLDNSNARTLLLSNVLDPGAADKNPLATMIVRDRPAAAIKATPSGPIVFDGKLELVGWSMPASVERGDTFQMTLVFHVLAPLSATWKVFTHFDPTGGATRFTADHAPIREACPASSWAKGDYIVDTFTVDTRHAVTTGTHTVWAGFWPGSGDKPRMKVTAAPDGARDKDERAKLGTITVK
jgi:hypothetical protein